MIQFERLIARAWRFAFTGVLITALHVLIVSLLVERLSLDPGMSNGIAFAISTAVSYTINTLWSFSEKIHGRTLLRFVLVSLLGFCISVTIGWGVQFAGYDYRIGIAGVVMVVPVVTYFLHTGWTYR